MTLMHREYEAIDPATLKPDPATYARTAGLVGNSKAEARRLVGAWRWPLLHQRQVYEKLLEWIDESESIIDFGGAAGPLGYGALVVDRIAGVRGLEEIDGPVDMIFTAHTLEHVADLGLLMCSFHWKLRAGGRLVALVPSYENEMLRAENWDFHAQTFCMSGDEELPEHYVRLDQLFARHRFQPVLAAEGYKNFVLFGEKR